MCSYETPRSIPMPRAQKRVRFQEQQRSWPASVFLEELKDAQRESVAREPQSFEMGNLKKAQEISAQRATEQLSRVEPSTAGRARGEAMMMAPMKPPRSRLIKKGAVQANVGEVGASGSGGQSEAAPVETTRLI